MFLAVDIGNSSIKFGVFDHDRLTAKFSIPTKRDYWPSELVEVIGTRLDLPVDAAIVSSVVPEANDAISYHLTSNVGVEPRFVRTTDDFGLKFDFPVDTTGTDRLINSLAAAEIYGAPCIVVSLGTATTIDVVDRNRKYFGGIIAPGMAVSAKALALAASKLPEVDIRRPEHVIGKTTDAAIRSGIVYGHIAMVEGLLQRAIDELQDKPRVIATGGYAEIVASEISLIDVVDADLTLRGLRLLSER